VHVYHERILDRREDEKSRRLKFPLGSATSVHDFLRVGSLLTTIRLSGLSWFQLICTGPPVGLCMDGSDAPAEGYAKVETEEGS
jgi:hypothetical protein